MGMYNGRELLTISQATKRADVSRRTIHNWVQKGKVEYIHTASNHVRIFADTLFRTAKGEPVKLPQRSVKVAS